MAIIDGSRLEVKPREHSDNKHIVQREYLKIGLVSARPSEKIPVHLYAEGEQFYHVPEGERVLSRNSEIFRNGRVIAVVIPPHLPHGVQNSSATPLRYLDFFGPKPLTFIL